MVHHLNILNKVLNFSAERYLKTAGDLFIYDGDYETALSMVDKTIEIEPEDTRALVLRGDILFCLNRDQEALESFNQAIEHNPLCVEAYISKAGVLDAFGKHREALNCCNKAAMLMGRQHDFLLPSLFDQKLSLMIRLKKYQEARTLLQTLPQELSKEDSDYLLASYKGIIDRACRERQRRKQDDKPTAMKVLSFKRS